MDLSKDERFRKVSQDPRFWEMPVKEQKIKIDKRFKAMFHEKQFKLKYTVDKRGRPFVHTSGEDLKKFYKLSDEDIEDDDALNEDHLPQITDDRTKRVTSTQRPTGRVGPFKHRDVERKMEKHCSELKKKHNKVKSKQKANKQTADKDEVRKNDDVQKRSLNKKRERDFETSDRVHCSNDKTQTSEKIKEQIVSPMKTPQSKRAAVPLTSGSERNEFDKRCKDDVERIEEEDDDSEADDGDSEEIEDSNDDESDSETEEEEGVDHCGPDFARGGGELESSSDEEEFFELFQNEPETVEHAWGELANDAQRDDTVTRRLALCNMDWDRIKAKDLLLLFDSFKPKGGVIFSVKIYPSEIGKKRMKDDELYGPQEFKNDKFNIDENIPEKQNCVKKMFMETMRQYQMNRLKYHFAIIDCDSVETASAIYKGCDGFEFECSGSFIDLRFVPDEMTFDDEPKDVSEELDTPSFKPKYFTTAALRQSKVELTWDEGDHDRVQVLTRKRFSQDEILDMDVKAYLASSSSSEEDAEDLMVRDNVHEEDEEVTQSPVETKMCEADVINKYKELLKSIQEEDDKKQQNDMEMEITWVPGLKENAKEMVRRSTEAKKKLIPQQNYLEKKKQERKQRVKEKRKMAKGPQVEVGSDDDLPPGVDFNNEFHAEERQKPGVKSLKLKGTKKEECDSGVSAEDQAENDKQNALLSLLMMDEEVDDRKHFDYDNIVNQQNLTKRKKRMLLKKDKLIQEDNFQVDVQDPRFTALYSSHLFNLDPTNPSFRRTKATEALVQEKARRRCLEQEPVIPKPGCSTNAIFESTTSEETKKHMDSSLALLVKSVKAKAQQHHASKRPKLK